MFDDRQDAGHQLGNQLQHYKDENFIVLAIPRGGVEVGYEVAKALDSEFSLLITRKLPFPHNPESGFGAIAEDGSTYIYKDAAKWVQAISIDAIIEDQKREIERRIKVLRNGEPLPSLTDRKVILVDDGIAMGSTMRASIKLCKNKEAKQIVVAVPVSSAQRKREIGKLVDDTVVLETPPNFRAVAQVYRNWYDVSDKEVLEILKKWENWE